MNSASTGPECTASFGSLFLLCLLAGVTSACNRTEGSDQNPEMRQEEQWLVDVTDEVGLDFTYEAGATGKYYMPEIVGSGVGLLDYDNDGDLDICLTNGNHLLPDAARGGTLTNRLFRMEANGVRVSRGSFAQGPEHNGARYNGRQAAHDRGRPAQTLKSSAEIN